MISPEIAEKGTWSTRNWPSCPPSIRICSSQAINLSADCQDVRPSDPKTASFQADLTSPHPAGHKPGLLPTHLQHVPNKLPARSPRLRLLRLPRPLTIIALAILPEMGRPHFLQPRDQRPRGIDVPQTHVPEDPKKPMRGDHFRLLRVGQGQAGPLLPALVRPSHRCRAVYRRGGVHSSDTGSGAPF